MRKKLKMDIYDKCSKCKVKDPFSCFFYLHKITYKCPCVECLVKVLCRKACDYRFTKMLKSYGDINEK
jgi:hypothetical protein